MNCAAINSIVLDFKNFLDQKNYRAFRETGCKSVQLLDIYFTGQFFPEYILTCSIARPSCGSHFFTKLLTQKQSSFRLFTYFSSNTKW